MSNAVRLNNFEQAEAVLTGLGDIETRAGRVAKFQDSAKFYNTAVTGITTQYLSCVFTSFFDFHHNFRHRDRDRFQGGPQVSDGPRKTVGKCQEVPGVGFCSSWLTEQDPGQDVSEAACFHSRE